MGKIWFNNFRFRGDNVKCDHVKLINLFQSEYTEVIFHVSYFWNLTREMNCCACYLLNFSKEKRECFEKFLIHCYFISENYENSWKIREENLAIRFTNLLEIRGCVPFHFFSVSTTQSTRNILVLKSLQIEGFNLRLI